jgi:hypothetical protein
MVEHPLKKLVAKVEEDKNHNNSRTSALEKPTVAKEVVIPKRAVKVSHSMAGGANLRPPCSDILKTVSFSINNLIFILHYI